MNEHYFYHIGTIDFLFFSEILAFQTTTTNKQIVNKQME